ncbi:MULTISPECIES: flagellar motor switch phosphatase FliY [Brevibacillus]|jgi:flagellar motor switch protein FliN|uniref:Flagellar motor switch protein FliY n=1 Tax=Brevibacillus borstelensis AK1 TaxID=1300222 RepID=M8E4I2_9BACL|nr:flagellar motor switch phosphatase FliY [Brevibacillus borstelensis]EMT54181.1 flagellar motor switch protein FliY [Brevibacillus borstelensis AK1]KKX54005.1 flagellar motor switch protein FliN [Brevibacillus borstelensis cifa_chp40]MCC0563455.1 flagellar motor switch phosphatase FliY [Brevibacillus borstelensis]MCM3557836.1 flagellar motor switch phosphatase FliY [Brevibacillus borstelensis]MED1852510.1 flagellar motor switch phosphatase FliY [Brevibacillus borstelensis]
MSRDMLSQEEIDALLRANNLVEEETEQQSVPDVADYLSAFEQDALGEIGNISFGSAATALSTLLSQKVDITTPTVSMVQVSELEKEFPMPHVAVHVEYTDGFKGVNLLVVRMEDAAVVADLMMGGDGRPSTTEMSDLHISAVQEAMNQMMGSAATSMSTIFNQLVNITPPGIDVMDLAQGKGGDSFTEDDTPLVKVSFRLKVGEQGELIDSNIMQLLPLSFAKDMIGRLTGASDADAAAASPAEEAQAPSAPSQPAGHTEPTIPASPATQPPAAAAQTPYPEQPAQAPHPGYAPPPMGYQAPPMYQDPYGQHPYPPAYAYPPQYVQPPVPHAPQHFGAQPMNVANVKAAQFSPFGGGMMAAPDEQNLNLLLDIPLQVTVELGRTKKLIKDILDLSAGSIIQLDKLAGEHVDILVNNKLIAKGEVVVIDENFGVRVTDIISPIDRVSKLQ